MPQSLLHLQVRQLQTQGLLDMIPENLLHLQVRQMLAQQVLDMIGRSFEVWSSGRVWVPKVTATFSNFGIGHEMAEGVLLDFFYFIDHVLIPQILLSHLRSLPESTWAAERTTWTAAASPLDEYWYHWDRRQRNSNETGTSRRKMVEQSTGKKRRRAGQNVEWYNHKYGKPCNQGLWT